MAKLFEIDQEILSLIDEETGEILDFERLEELQLERDEKIKKVAQWYKNLIDDERAFKAQEEYFAKKKQSAKKNAEGLKNWLDYALGGAKFEANDKSVSITYRKSESVEIDDEIEFIDYAQNIGRDDLLSFKAPTINKTAVKALLKEGGELTGARIQVKQNIQIK